MKYVQAICALLLFCGTGVALLTQVFPMTDSGSSKTRMVKAIVWRAVDEFGETTAAIGFIAIGLVLAGAILAFSRSGDEAEA